MGTHDGKYNLSTYNVLLSFIYSIKRRFLVNLGVAAAEEEEAGIKATTKETGSSGVNSSEGDWWSREW
jgi:hypothetical protein